jgi:hypothetical protein
MVAANASILEAGLKTQNYDKGIDKYVRKFDPDEESLAVVSIHQGWQGDHGWAVAFKQGPRRCLLLNTTDGLTDDEALWTALSARATFQPRLKMQRRFPGKLFYPNAVSHIIQDFWNHPEDLGSSPGFSERSPICQAAMLAFSEGLSKLDLSSLEPLPVAEAPEKLARIANDAAISRLRPIADGPNQWEFHRSSGGTDGFTSQSTPVAGPELGPGSGLTGTCAESPSRPYT